MEEFGATSAIPTLAGCTESSMHPSGCLDASFAAQCAVPSATSCGLPPSEQSSAPTSRRASSGGATAEKALAQKLRRVGYVSRCKRHQEEDDLLNAADCRRHLQAGDLLN